MTPRFLIADDHPLVRAALSETLRRRWPEAELLEAADFDSVMARLAPADPLASDPEVDLVLLDLTMPGSNGLMGLMLLRAHAPTVPVAVVSAQEDAETVRRARAFGAAAFIPKSASVETIQEAIAAILRGDLVAPETAAPADADDHDLYRRLATLSPQQLRVLAMIGEGKLNKQICFELGIAEQTVKAHASQIFRKLGVVSRTQAALVMNRLTPSGL
ncbi:LuxR family transcriptional regulator [Elstera litoralis]|uniref:LuxR family transcriptional regulator n=1 Tax=Elstera litoralis TaxID=552518 RepID=A0A0F3IRQ3_9PROT|nr:response regulator transcription factor [Elstera litoralis]KJV09391.1 LuxR family transcriptional regulator [Elstera litoralis]